MRKVCDYQITTATGTGRNDWIRSAFYTGELATYYTTGDTKYLDQAVKWAGEANWTPNPADQRHADNLCCGQIYAELALLKNDPALVESFRAAVDRMMATPKKGRVDWWWCDALFMAPPAFARLAAVTGDRRYADFMNALWWDTTDFLFDTEDGLYYRDFNYFGKQTKNGKKVFWSRGNGWVMGGIARVLQYLPADDPHRRDFVKLLRQMAATLARVQGADGLWRSSLLDAEEFPSPESSGTGFDCFALAWGINAGILDRERYQPGGREGLEGPAWDGGRGRQGGVRAAGRGRTGQRIAPRHSGVRGGGIPAGGQRSHQTQESRLR